jgi:hypothetical protein
LIQTKGDKLVLGFSSPKKSHEGMNYSYRSHRFKSASFVGSVLVGRRSLRNLVELCVASPYVLVFLRKFFPQRRKGAKVQTQRTDQVFLPRFSLGFSLRLCAFAGEISFGCGFAGL